MPTTFGDIAASRWLQAQPLDIQDLLNNYAQVRCSGLALLLLFEAEEFALATQCQAHRFARPEGLPELRVELRFSDRVLPALGTVPRPPTSQV